MIFRIMICLGIALVIFVPILAVWAWNRRKIAQYEQRVLSDRESESYFMRMSPFWFITGIAGCVFFYGLTALTVFLAEPGQELYLSDLTGVLLFMAFTFLCEYLCVMSLLWAIKVDVEDITVYRFPLRPKVISFHEITRVRYIERPISDYRTAKRQLIAYHDRKKLFEAADDMSHFGILLKRLEAEKGLEKGFLKEGGFERMEYQENFSVSETTADKVRAFFCALIGIVMLVAGILCWDEREELPNYLLYYVGVFLLFLMLMGNFIYVMMRKVTITYQDIYVRDIKSFMKDLLTPGEKGGVRHYSMSDITRVEDKENFIVLYANGKDDIPIKIAKIWKSDKNFALLVKRFEMAGKWKNLGQRFKVRRS